MAFKFLLLLVTRPRLETPPRERPLAQRPVKLPTGKLCSPRNPKPSCLQAVMAAIGPRKDPKHHQNLSTTTFSRNHVPQQKQQVPRKHPYPSFGKNEQPQGQWFRVGRLCSAESVAAIEGCRNLVCLAAAVFRL